MNKKGNIANLTRAGLGRPKGSKNKYYRAVKDMVEEAIEQRGGVEFFKSLPAESLARISAKLIPQALEANITGSMAHTINVIDYSTVGKMPKKESTE